jgi:hypothetical protein
MDFEEPLHASEKMRCEMPERQALLPDRNGERSLQDAWRQKHGRTR